ncbi:EthD domain-containing protein [Paraburkholderia hospita]|uniref:EthD domain-containing protein n=1 Tax=Paraburkholderia hospita TaxID=169430 RepID=UPI000271C6F4|nr:EthD domain-containing protein [Paraburkholderia hospita]EUC16605.1 Ethyl tert-butyl ether degradation EthD [Burkholderia sp. BT03]SKC69044.1 Methylmuconolactone methyl-isomerase [Paraburkholderia hospita]SKC77552.1 Methylmuconolactone methyl-isomerase [Paraburkholderia hospita]
MSKVRMGLISKKADWSIEDFRKHWLNHHGPLVRNAPGLSQYWQNHVTDRLQRGIDFVRGPWEFDGFSQLRVSDLQKPFGTGELPERILADENHFLGQLHIVTVEQTAVVEVPVDAIRSKIMKRMSVIRRCPEMSESEFLSEWKVHADWVRTMPGVLGYRQNAVVERELRKGHPCNYEELPIDGIVEFWFESTNSLQEAFRSEAGLTTMAHAKTFLSEITAFLVAEHRIF